MEKICNITKDKMNRIQAIEQSEKGTATRTIYPSTGFKETIIAYKDGTGFVLVSLMGKVQHEACRAAKNSELEGFYHWEPSK